ncbi:MAG: biotin/lipoyl-binding protein [Nitrososphaerota archaeon]|nr:biotin/lipoyl-binding protein [Nitrososphaerota archaeon]
MTRYELNSDDGDFTVDAVSAGDAYDVTVSGKAYGLKIRPGSSAGTLVAELSGRPLIVTSVRATQSSLELTIGGERFAYRRVAAATRTVAAAIAPTSASPKDVIAAPMPGKVISALVQEGAKVKAGDPLVILESMKMEVAVRADRDCEVAEVLAEEGAAVRRGQGLVRVR